LRRIRQFACVCCRLQSAVSFSGARKEPGKYIDSIAETIDIIGAFKTADWKYLELLRKIIKSFFPFKKLSHDLVDRIAVMPITLGIYSVERIYRTWRQGCDEFMENNPKQLGWIALATNVQTFYEHFGVVWTECQGNSDYRNAIELALLTNREKNKRNCLNDYINRPEQAERKTNE